MNTIRHLGKDLANLWFKTHIQHAVSLPLLHWRITTKATNHHSAAVQRTPLTKVPKNLIENKLQDSIQTNLAAEISVPFGAGSPKVSEMFLVGFYLRPTPVHFQESRSSDQDKRQWYSAAGIFCEHLI